MNHVIIFATRNQGKKNEILKVAKRFNLADRIYFPENEYPETAEEFDTFEANARQKAQDAALFFSAHTNIIFIGDDSGMEIASLGGAPGVRTRHWSGTKLTDAEFDQYCLKQLEGKTRSDRDAVLKSTLCLIDNDSLQYFYGTLKGRILEKPRKIHTCQEGFPVATLFYIPQADDVLGNLQGSTNSSIKTHREMALENLFEHITTTYHY